MRAFLNTLIGASALSLAASGAFAQDADTETPAEAPAETAAEAPADGADVLAQDPTISMGEEVKENLVGTVYAREAHGDWELRCVRAPEGQKEPCQLYQLLNDSEGNPVSEINFFFVATEQGQAAGATVVTPLATLLLEQLRLSVDGGSAKRYPFAWCTQAGCFSRLGFTPDDVASFKRGAKAQITIVPLQAPDAEVTLDVSLTGFTAGFDALVADVTAQ